MKSNLCPAPSILPCAFVIVAIGLLATIPRTAAEDIMITNSAAEFQRLVYSAHLMTQIAEKPELEASLEMLLELQRRNPLTPPTNLAELSRQALQRFRTNAPSYIRTNGYRDEILATYLETFYQIPSHTNLVMPTLQLFSHFLLSTNDFTNSTPAKLIHSGNQRLLSSYDTVEKRLALLDTCTDRAKANAKFSMAMDHLLVPETLFSVTNTPAEILNDPVSPLHDNESFQRLLQISSTNANGSLIVSSNLLMTLFTNETQILWAAISNNVDMLRELNKSQADLLSYLTNQAAMDGNEARITALKKTQAPQIATATAALLVQSKLMEAAAIDSTYYVPQKFRKVVTALDNICRGLSTAISAGKATDGVGAVLGIGGVEAGLVNIFDLCSGVESADETILREIGNIQTLISNLNVTVNYRFDRVDNALNQIYQTLCEGLSYIDHDLGLLTKTLEFVRGNLLEQQSNLHRLERHLGNYLNELGRRDLKLKLNESLNYEAGNHNLYWMDYLRDYRPAAIFFMTYATDDAFDELCAPSSDRDYSPTGLFWELTESEADISGVGLIVTNRLDQKLKYIQTFLDEHLDGNGPYTGPYTDTDPSILLPNPRDWFMGAYAFMQLAAENPTHFRVLDPNNYLGNIPRSINDLTNFLRSLTLKDNQVNWALHGALRTYYLQKLADVTTTIRDLEQQYASELGFALDTWRQWSAASPRVIATETKVLAVPPPPAPIPRDVATQISAGGSHSLAAKSDGTVVAWGNNDNGQCAIPDNATNVMAISGGLWHSLALRTDGTVLAWGAGTNNIGAGSSHGQSMVPADLSSVKAIAAGSIHSLALMSNGTIRGWGSDEYGQSTGPQVAANVQAIAAGYWHSLALHANRTVLGWGFNWNGEINVPPNLTNVEAIAAGAYHSLALKEDGTVVAWGYNVSGQTNVPVGLSNVVAIAAGHSHSLALKADGTVVAWGDNNSGQTNVPAWLNNVIGIGAGGNHSLALKADGTVVAWGANNLRQCLIPSSLTWKGAIAAGGSFSLALQADGTVVGWPENASLPTPEKVPVSATNIVAIAAGYLHGLALQADGSVLGWGYNRDGQATGVANNIYPCLSTGLVAVAGHTLCDVVAIAAHQDDNLALRATGTVVCWGRNSGWTGVTNGPLGDVMIDGELLTNVVAIAMGSGHYLALKSDGTVVGWGRNYEGQATGVPNPIDPGVSAGLVMLSGAPLSNVVAIAAGSYHSMAIKADGTVVGWGLNNYGQATGVTNGPPGIVIYDGEPLTGVVAISPTFYSNLALKTNGTVIAWGFDYYAQNSIPESVNNVVSIAAAATGSHSLALKADGTVVSWGDSYFGPTTVPDHAIDLAAIAAGGRHALALKTNGTLVAWGRNDCNQDTIPSSATDVVAIASGTNFNLALKADGTVLGWGYNRSGQATGVPNYSSPYTSTGLVQWAGQTLDNVIAIEAGNSHALALKINGEVVGWGDNYYGQTTIPESAKTKVVALAAGGYHSLALKADGSVVGWGAGQYVGGGREHKNYAQSTIPDSANNVVAIAAGGLHSLALRHDGTVVAWGFNDFGQVTGTRPVGQHYPAVTSIVELAGQTLNNIVAISAGGFHSLALKANGAAVAWGDNSYSQINIPANATNIVSISAGSDFSLLLTVDQADKSVGYGEAFFARADVPYQVGNLLADVNAHVLTNFNSDLTLYTNAIELSGAKALLTAVLELGLPYTLERDEILHGFLYGKECLVDSGTAWSFLDNEISKLRATVDARPLVLPEVAGLRFQLFVDRLDEHLNRLAANGQPETPRLVSHTLRLLNLLRLASMEGTSLPGLEIADFNSANKRLTVNLYGEPYAHYMLQHCTSFTGNNPVVGNWWPDTVLTNLHNETTFTPPVAGPPHFYRLQRLNSP